MSVHAGRLRRSEKYAAGDAIGIVSATPAQVLFTAPQATEATSQRYKVDSASAAFAVIFPRLERDLLVLLIDGLLRSGLQATTIRLEPEAVLAEFPDATGGPR